MGHINCLINCLCYFGDNKSMLRINSRCANTEAIQNSSFANKRIHSDFIHVIKVCFQCQYMDLLSYKHPITVFICIAHLDTRPLSPCFLCCSVVGKHSPSPCLYHSWMLFECSRGRDPFSREVLCLQCCVHLCLLFPPHSSFLMHLGHHSHTHSPPGPIHMHTQTNLLGLMNLIESPHLKRCGR